MKNILLGTSVLVGAAALFAGAANADTPKVTLGGNADFQVGVVSEKDDANKRSGAFKSEHEINVNVDGKTDGGLGYGAMLDIVASGTGDNTTSGVQNDGQAPHNYVYLDGAWGRIQGGSDIGVTNTMKVDASKIARATGGIDGDFNYFFSAPSSMTGATPTALLVATPDLFLDYGLASATVVGNGFGDESTESLNKISYYTPRFSGFQAGVSYIFSDNYGTRGINVDRSNNFSTGAFENIFTGAANYEGKFSDVGVKLGATGEHGKAQKTSGLEDLRTWQAGAEVDYMGFSVAGSYADLGDSGQALGSGLDNTHFWTLGGAYETGPYGVSVTYMNSNVQDSTTTDTKFTNLSLGADYKLAPGLTPYAEVDFIKVDGPGTGVANDNKGTVFIAGSALSF